MKSDPVDSPPECGGDGRDDEQPTRVTDVEFVVNCFERNIDAVTTPGTLAALSGQHVFGFRIRTLLINNVTDRERAESLAEGAVERGEIDRYAFVDQWADRAFRATRLEPGDFGPFLHWSDCVLAALALEGPEFLCYQDVDTRLLDPADWMSMSTRLGPTMAA